MKLLVTLALACALFSTAYPLECYQCTENAPCSQYTCPSIQTKCGSATAEVIVGQTQTVQRVKSCAAPSECGRASVNFGISRTTVNTLCCESNLCNRDYAPPLSDSTLNGKKCFTCVGDDCTHTLECLGPEDRCIKASVSTGGQTVTLKGCASQNACAGSLNSRMGNTDMEISCCEGKMCNNALRIGQSILFLFLVPLASFILFN